MSELKILIRNAQLGTSKVTCQYCCIGKARSIDHFLPISEYPEFSVLSNNLIPCCKDCNEKKKSYWKEGSDRGIINFYLDNISDQQFLYSKVSFNGSTPYIEFEIHNKAKSIDKYLFGVIEKKFTRLDLIQKYNEESTEELSELVENICLYSKKPSELFLRKKTE